MRFSRIFNVFAFLCAVMFTGSVQAQVLPDFTRLVEQNADAIVNVSSVIVSTPDENDEERLEEILRYYFGERLDDIPDERLREFRERPALGSGFIISEDGYIITNHHVVENADEVSITLNDRREFKATIIGSDVSSDLALLKIEASNLKPVVLGSSSTLKVGEWVLAIGSPMGLQFSVAAGIISYMGRNIPNGSGGNYVSFIQTDVAINPGNSGGPLFNLRGEVIGINSQIFTNTGGSMGLSFAIPVDVARNVIGQLRDKGLVERGWMGVGINDVSQEIADEAGLLVPGGALVTQVISGSPADKAGFMSGDIILKFNNADIISSGDLPFQVGMTAPESVAAVDLFRDGMPMTISMTVGKLATAGGPVIGSRGMDNDTLGLMITEQDSSDGPEGIMIVRVTGPVARDAGFEEGDILLSLDGEATTTMEAFNQVVEQLPRGQVLPALIERNDRQFYLTVSIPE